jgi:hypothetical protein
MDQSHTVTSSKESEAPHTDVFWTKGQNFNQPNSSFRQAGAYLFAPLIDIPSSSMSAAIKITLSTQRKSSHEKGPFGRSGLMRNYGSALD